MIIVGQLSLLGAFVASGYAAFACVLGSAHDRWAIRRSGIIAAVLGFLLLTFVMVVLAYGLLANDYRLAYVAQYSSSLLPWYYAFSALWVGQAGSLLLWAWLSMLLALVFRLLPNRQCNSLREPTFGILMSFCCFLVATMVFAADPMAVNVAVPKDGVGLSPLLQHPNMLIHPPVVFLAYSAWSIPFALAIAALATNQLDVGWTRLARPWALFAWIVLGGGILLGAKWAYEELGWGGYWGWDPVENGSLIPWLTGTATIHALMAWRRGGHLKKSTCVLAIGTFCMCNFATFLTRSGVFSSLHAFSQSSTGWLFLGLMLALVASGSILIFRRRANLVADRAIGTVWCRESMIVVNMLALLALAIVTFVGTICPVISDAIMGRKVVVGLAFFNNALMPAGLVLMMTTALAPLLRWQSAPTKAQLKALTVSAVIGLLAGGVSFVNGVDHPVLLSVICLFAFAVAVIAASSILEARRWAGGNWSDWMQLLRSRRQLYGGFVIHLGLFCLALGIAASSLNAQQHEVVMQEGETIQWLGHRVRLAQIVQRELPDKLVAEARLELLTDSSRIARVTPAKHFHRLQGEWTSEVSVHSSWRGDFYTILQNGEGPGQVRLTLVDNPMMRWIWFGGWMMGVGSLLGLWPARRTSAATVAARDKPIRSVRQGQPALVNHLCH